MRDGSDRYGTQTQTQKSIDHGMKRPLAHALHTRPSPTTTVCICSYMLYGTGEMTHDGMRIVLRISALSPLSLFSFSPCRLFTTQQYTLLGPPTHSDCFVWATGPDDDNLHFAQHTIPASGRVRNASSRPSMQVGSVLAPSNVEQRNAVLRFLTPPRIG